MEDIDKKNIIIDALLKNKKLRDKLKIMDFRNKLKRKNKDDRN